MAYFGLIELWALINTPNEHETQEAHQLNEFKFDMELNYLAEIRCTHVKISTIFLMSLFSGIYSVDQKVRWRAHCNNKEHFRGTYFALGQC
jgi:hypothetical protein